MSASLRKLADDFLRELVSRGYSHHTINAYRTDIEQLVSSLSSRRAGVEDLTAEALSGFLGALARRGMSRATVIRKGSSARAFGDYLVAERYLRLNPMDRVAVPRRVVRIPVVPQARELCRSLDGLPRTSRTDLRNAAMIELFYGAGIRVAELTGLNVADYERGDHPGDATVRVLGKGLRERVIPIGAPAHDAIDAYLAGLGGIWRPDDPLFTGLGNRRISVREVQRIVKARLGTTPHALRHAFATHMLDGGCDLLEISALLGHQSVASTQIYTRVAAGRLVRIHGAAHPRARQGSNGCV